MRRNKSIETNTESRASSAVKWTPCFQKYTKLNQRMNIDLPSSKIIVYFWELKMFRTNWRRCTLELLIWMKLKDKLTWNCAGRIQTHIRLLLIVSSTLKLITAFAGLLHLENLFSRMRSCTLEYISGKRHLCRSALVLGLTSLTKVSWWIVGVQGKMSVLKLRLKWSKLKEGNKWSKDLSTSSKQLSIRTSKNCKGTDLQTLMREMNSLLRFQCPRAIWYNIERLWRVKLRNLL